MDARAEQASLATDPLPPVVIVDPLTRVWDLDRQIAALQEQIDELTQQRTEALNYAVQRNITEDGRCRLEQKIRRVRTLDPVRFREVFPEEYMTACDVERRDLEERMEHIGEKINLTLVDKLVKKVRLEAAPGVVTVKESVSYAAVLK